MDELAGFTPREILYISNNNSEAELKNAVARGLLISVDSLSQLDMVEDVLAVQDDWCQWHECEESPSLRAENEAINRVLSHWNCFMGLSGGSLYVDGKMVAFSVGENLDGESLGVHYEKGLNGFKGVYQTINCLFSRNAGDGFTYINRAQDLDEEGLRQAKMTYLPADFLRKFKVRIRKG
jgi:Uncharacterized conserved protein